MLLHINIKSQVNQDYDMLKLLIFSLHDLVVIIYIEVQKSNAQTDPH
jgi:hypothetical protein